MKLVSRGYQKYFLAILIFQFALASFIVFNGRVENVSAPLTPPTSPYIKIIPDETINSSLTVGSNYTISVRTDYNGSDIWSWQFSLNFDPYVLQGGIGTTTTWNGTGTRRVFYAPKERTPLVADSEKIYVNNTLKTRNVDYLIDYSSGKINFTAPPPNKAPIKAVYLGYSVVNGDLITTVKDTTATFLPGTTGFDNIAGTLSLVGAFFDYVGLPTPPTTYGPGILANVTFRVVGTGYSNITLEHARLVGYSPGKSVPGYPAGFYPIVDSTEQPDHIGHGYFDNIPNVYDVAVMTPLTPLNAIQREVVAIDVTVRNEGNLTGDFDLVINANATIVGTKTINLTRGAKTTLTFYWNTTEELEGTYIINATAWFARDIDLGDNSKTAQTEVKSVHNVALTNLEVQMNARVGMLIPINVTARNEGSFEENVNVTISYQRFISNPPPPTNITTVNFTLSEFLENKTIPLEWNTTGFVSDYYVLRATVALALDEEFGDNEQTQQVILDPAFIHDVEIVAVSATPSVLIGQNVEINVTIRNDGTFNETLIEVKVNYDSKTIGSQSVSLVAGENKTMPFTWSTTGIAADTYSVSAEAILVGDATPGNNIGVAAVTIQALPPGHIAGRVTDSSNGNAIAGANVTAEGQYDLTDSNGYFNITNIPAGKYNVTAVAPGYQSSTKTGIAVVTGETTNLNFVLTAIPITHTNGHIAGVVIDFSTGDPIVGATVTANNHSTSTDANGSYNIELQPGTYTVTASAQGYEDSLQTGISVKSGETTTLNFKLTKAAQQQTDITAFIPFIIGAIIVVIVIAGIAVYFLKIRRK